MSLDDFKKFEERVQRCSHRVRGCLMQYATMGNGLPLVLVNGMGGNYALFYKTFLALSPRFRVIGFNQRGESGDGTVPGCFSHEDLVNDLTALLDHLGLERVHLLGMSFGGTIAQQFAIQNPDRLDRLILNSTFARRPLLWFENCLARFVLRTGFALHQLPGRALFSRFSHCKQLYRENPERLCFLCENSMDTPAETLAKRALLIDDFDSRDRLSEVCGPTLILYGDKDTLVPESCQRELEEKLPNSQVRVIHGGGHFLMLSQPETYNETIRDFLRGGTVEALTPALDSS